MLAFREIRNSTSLSRRRRTELYEVQLSPRFLMRSRIIGTDLHVAGPANSRARARAAVAFCIKRPVFFPPPKCNKYSRQIGRARKTPSERAGRYTPFPRVDFTKAHSAERVQARTGRGAFDFFHRKYLIFPTRRNLLKTKYCVCVRGHVVATNAYGDAFALRSRITNPSVDAITAIKKEAWRESRRNGANGARMKLKENEGPLYVGGIM